MIAIEDLTEASSSPEALQDYLSRNSLEVYDFFMYQPYSLLDEAWREIDRYILLRRAVIMALDIGVERNVAFQAMLLDLTERFHMRSAFTFLFNHLHENAPRFIGHRVLAASRYLIGNPTLPELIARYDHFYDDLKRAYEEEEDDKNRLLATFVTCYSSIVRDFGQFNHEGVARFKAKVERSLAEDENSFLNHPLVLSVLQINLDDFEIAFQAIQTLLDTHLERNEPRPEFWNEYITETDGQYHEQVYAAARDFMTIKTIAAAWYQEIMNTSIFNSLNRGTAILREERQLFGYLYSYGENHYQKILSALPAVPVAVWSSPFSIVDWACGQGLATMGLNDFLTARDIVPTIRSVSLIEPSELALRRASMHISHLQMTNQIYTIHRDFGSLVEEELRHDNRVAKVHLFSNVLDMDKYSMSDLCTFIESKFRGPNYFVCCSPFQDGLKAHRIDSFVDFFSEKEGFHQYLRLNEARGSWMRDWTRCIRVFYADL